MAIKQKYLGVKKGRSFIMNSNDQLVLGNFLQKFEDGQELEMTVSKRYIRRTSGLPGEETNFNGYLWGVAYKMIGDHIGEMDLDYIHHWVQICVGNVKGMPDGQVVPLGTSDMSGGEFAEYCSKVRIWAGKPEGLSLYLPEPNEAEWSR